MTRLQDIQIRDPFILADQASGKYYLYGTTDKNCWGGPGTGFDCYASTDLAEWDGPIAAFRPKQGFWGETNFWAPEIHAYRDRYYLFATFYSKTVCRGTAILVSEYATGPFREHSAGAVTPAEWMCLDGTFYVDTQGTPWMIFCHEWTQVGDGEMCAVQLSEDLTRAQGEPTVLFTASQAKWVRPLQVAKAIANGWIHEGEFKAGLEKAWITDGPFVYRTKAGGLLMFWSSFDQEGYAAGIARSKSGSVLGPWKHDEKSFYPKDGGHGMLFETFEGNRIFTLHRPNMTPDERTVFVDVSPDVLEKSDCDTGQGFCQ